MALSSSGKVLYAIAFTVLLPVALAGWAASTAGMVRIPSIASLPWGLPVAAAGAALAILGMAHIWIYGGGLPMNVCPPPRYVSQGIYRLLPHPIYTGFPILCAGVSIAAL